MVNKDLRLKAKIKVNRAADFIRNNWELLLTGSAFVAFVWLSLRESDVESTNNNNDNYFDNPMKRDFICSYCGNKWSQKADEDGLCDGYGLPPCPMCGTPGSDPTDYADFVCPNCKHEWRNYGNGGLVLGCIPSCPKCRTIARKV